MPKTTTPNKSREELLCHAARFRPLEDIVTMIEKEGINPNCSFDQESPLFISFLRGETNIILYLLEKGADPFVTLSESPIYMALLSSKRMSYESRLEITTKFVEEKPDIIKDVLEHISYLERKHITESDRNERTTKIIENFNTLHQQRIEAQKNLRNFYQTEETLGLNQQRRSKFNDNDISAEEKLCQAVGNGSLEVVKEMIEVDGVSPNCTFFSKSLYYPNFSPLLMAVKDDKIDMIRYLLDKGASPFIEGKEPFIQNDNSTIYKSLLANNSLSYENRLEITKEFAEKKPEIITEVLGFINSVETICIKKSDRTQETAKLIEDLKKIEKDQKDLTEQSKSASELEPNQQQSANRFNPSSDIELDFNERHGSTLDGERDSLLGARQRTTAKFNNEETKERLSSSDNDQNYKNPSSKPKPKYTDSKTTPVSGKNNDTCTIS